jgi:hypothetical protein
MIFLGYAVAAVLVLLPGIGLASIFALDPWAAFFSFAAIWALVSGGLYAVDKGLKFDIPESLRLRNGFLYALWPGWLAPIATVLSFSVLFWAAVRGTVVALVFLQLLFTSSPADRPQVIQSAQGTMPEFMAWLASPFGLDGLLLAAGLAIAILATIWETGERREHDLELWNRRNV